jgi:dTDP-glucose 4,6-dehydratase
MSNSALFVTGGAGFIGSNFFRLILRVLEYTSGVNFDALTYAGDRGNLLHLENNARYSFVRGDICDRATVAAAIHGVDAVVHFAAESHVDRSIADSSLFIRTNVLGTQVLLDAALRAGVKKFVHVSTDEVYGALGDQGKFTETTPLRPRSPYAASKAAGDLLAQSYFETHGLPVCIVRPSNNYGPYQYPEKFVPLMVTNLIEGRKVPVYGEGLNVRDWLHVQDCCRGILAVLEHGAPGEVYNIGGGTELRNIDLVRTVLEAMGRGDDAIEFVRDRPGHDYRYALDSTKITRELGWRPEIPISDGLAQTVRWYQEHPDWWKPLKARLEREARGFWSTPPAAPSR